MPSGGASHTSGEPAVHWLGDPPDRSCDHDQPGTSDLKEAVAAAHEADSPADRREGPDRAGRAEEADLCFRPDPGQVTDPGSDEENDHSASQDGACLNEELSGPEDAWPTLPADLMSSCEKVREADGEHDADAAADVVLSEGRLSLPVSGSDLIEAGMVCDAPSRAVDMPTGDGELSADVVAVDSLGAPPGESSPACQVAVCHGQTTPAVVDRPEPGPSLTGSERPPPDPAPGSQCRSPALVPDSARLEPVRQQQLQQVRLQGLRPPRPGLSPEQEQRPDAERTVSLPRRPRFLVIPTADKNNKLKYMIEQREHRTEPTRLAPPDGGWGWVVLAGSMAINILIPGFIKSFGVLFDDVCTKFDASPAAVSWIPALSFFMYNFMGLAAGALCQKYSCRVTTMLGGVLASAGLLVCYCANHIYYVYIGMGLMSGCGGCFAYCSGILVVGSYFERRRGLANGLCVSGSALGAVIFPPALDAMLDRFGFSESMLLVSAALLHVVPCAALYQPVERHMVRVPAGCVSPPPPPAEERAAAAAGPPLASRSATPLGRPPSPAGTVSSCGSVQSLCYLSTVLHGSSLAVSQKEASHQIIEAALRRRAASECSPEERSAPPPPPPARRPLIELTLLWNPVFLLMIASSALFQIAISNVLVILPSYVTQLGYARQQASLLLSLFAGCDLVGRVSGAGLSDLGLLPRRCYLLAAYLLSGTALASLPAAAGLYAAACLAVALAGLGAGVVMGIYSVMLIEYLGLERLGSSYGLSVCLGGVTLLAGPPLVGLLRQAAPSPHLVVYLLAVLPFLAAAVWGLMPHAQAHVRRQEHASQPTPHDV